MTSGRPRRRTPALALLAVLAVVAVSACGGTATSSTGSSRAGEGPVTVTVAAASDLKFALDEIAELVTEQDPQLRLAVTYGSSGTFYQQLVNGAPFDLYLSADQSYPQALVDAGLADPDDLFQYAVGRLVVWAATSSPVDPDQGLATLASPQARTVAIANPEHAPYGVAAVAAMRTAGVYDVAADKLVLGENIAQAAEFTLSGNADVGVIALSLALSPQLSERGAYSEVPLDSFPRLDQGGVVLGSADEAEAARAVRDILLGEQGRAILARYGFFEPGT